MDFTLRGVAATFPAGTSVSAYAGVEFVPTDSLPAAAATATVANDGSLAFTGLAEGVRYVASAVVGTRRWIRFSTEDLADQNVRGVLWFGEAQDTNLYRAAADTLKTDDAFQAPSVRTTSSNLYTYSGVYFGPSDDASIAYVSAGKLSSAQFVATDGVTTKVVAGAVSDGSFTVTPASGTIAVDTSNSKIYVRVGSTWKSVTVA